MCIAWMKKPCFSYYPLAFFSCWVLIASACLSHPTEEPSNRQSLPEQQPSKQSLPNRAFPIGTARYGTISAFLPVLPSCPYRYGTEFLIRAFPLVTDEEDLILGLSPTNLHPCYGARPRMPYLTLWFGSPVTHTQTERKERGPP